MQYLFIVETNSICKSDRNYLYGIVKNYYDIRGQKLNFIYLNSKTRYDQVKTKTEQIIDKYLDGETVVFMCIDLDEINNENKKLNNSIIKYSKENNYELIWFYEDIESALLKRKVNDKNKKKESEKFLNNKLYLNLDVKLLSKSKISLEKNTSNVFCVLDKYLSRKI